MSILSSPARKAMPAIPEEENDLLRISIVLKIALGIVVCLELLAPFVSTSYGLDSRHHLQWISEFTTLVANGALVPRWVPTGFGGFGAATFYFYPPVTLYLTSIISSVTSITSATILFQTVSFLMTIGSFFTARLFLRSIGSQRYQMNLGAILYTVAPFRIVELYHRGALPTHVAYVLIPLVWLGLVAIIRPDSNIGGNTLRQYILILGMSSALLVLTSVPVAFVTMICIGIAALVVWRNIHLAALLNVALAAGLAVALSAFHYSAVLYAQPYTRINEVIGFYPKMRFSSLLAGINWLYVYHLNFVYIPPMLIGLAYWKLRISDKANPNDPEILAARIGLVLLIFITYLNILPLSRIVWNTLLPFQLIQFGLRFYSHLLLFVCVLIGIAKSKTMKRAALASATLLMLGAIPPAILVVFNLHLFPHYSAPPTDSEEYRPIYTVPIGNFIQTMHSHDADPPTMIANIQYGEKVQSYSKSPTLQQFKVTLDAQRTVTFHQFYWPAWHLYANGLEIDSHPDSIGRAVATLPAGQYTATWRLEQTPLETAGSWVSGVAWSGVIIFAGIGFVRRRVRKKATISE